jgi:hypothetical protein
MAATLPEVERGTRIGHHEDTRREDEDAENRSRCCHLVGPGGETLCGTRGWGIRASDEEANLRGPKCDGPHGCGSDRCPACATRA